MKNRMLHPLGMLGTLLIIVLILGESLLLTNRPTTVRLMMDQRAGVALLDGFHSREYDDTRAWHGGGSYRWTKDQSHVVLYQPGNGARRVFHLWLGPSLPGQAADHVTLRSGELSIITLPVDHRPRHYRVLLPDYSDSSTTVAITFESETVIVPPDERAIGVRVEGVALSWLDTGLVWISWQEFLLQLVFLTLVACLLLQMKLSLPVIGVVLMLAIAWLISLYASGMLLIVPYLLRLTLVLGVLVLLTWWIPPLIQRAIGDALPADVLRVVWGIMLIGWIIRLSGSLYPPFAPYDISHNLERLIKSASGTLVVTNPSIEFRGGTTIYPPGPYLVLLPNALLGIPPQLLLHAGIAFVDGIGVLATAWMARLLGMGTRVVIFSALFYAGLPILLTALWWGHSAQIFGQALMVPMAIVLLLLFKRSTSTTSPHITMRSWWPYWCLVALLLSMALLSHIGVAIVAVVWLGLLVGMMRVWGTLSAWAWWRLVWVIGACCLFSFLVLYSIVLLMKLDQMADVGQRIISDYEHARGLILRGFQIAFHRLGFVLLFPGLWLLWKRRLPVGGTELIGAWLGVVVLFCTIELISGLQVRYIYFFSPIACILIALALNRLMAWGRLARFVAWVVALLLLLQSTIVWYIATFEDIRMSVSPLVR